MALRRLWGVRRLSVETLTAQSNEPLRDSAGFSTAWSTDRVPVVALSGVVGERPLEMYENRFVPSIKERSAFRSAPVLHRTVPILKERTLLKIPHWAPGNNSKPSHPAETSMHRAERLSI